MTLIELQKVLGNRIEEVSKRTTYNADFNQSTQSLVSIAKQMINNADVIIRTDKLCKRNDRSNYIVGEVPNDKS